MSCASQVVLAQKPVIADTGGAWDPSLLGTLLHHLSSLASVYHKPPEVSRPALVSYRKILYQRSSLRPML